MKETPSVHERYTSSNEAFVRWNAKTALGIDAQCDKREMLADPRIAGIMADVSDWPGVTVNSHKSAKASFQKLAFLADIGIRSGDAGMDRAIAKILDTFGSDGLPRLPMNVSASFGGSGNDTMAWAACDAPVTVYALRKMGVTDARVEAGIRAIAGFVSDTGVPCVVSPELGSWHGPGKRSDPCPFATLAVLKALLGSGENYQKEITHCSDVLRRLWRESMTWKPYIFYMGTDFRKLKLPFIWYDILNVADALSRVKGAETFPELAEMAGIISARHGKEEGFIPESAYQHFKAWDFGQKKKPSEWMGWVAECILERAGAWAQPE